MSYENAVIPFRTWGNRQVLYEEDLHNKPWLRTFVEAFPHCFEFDPHRYLWVFYPGGKHEEDKS